MKMEMSPEQKVMLEAGITALETGIGQLNLAIEQFDQKRAEFVAHRDAALKTLAETRAKLGIETVIQ